MKIFGFTDYKRKGKLKQWGTTFIHQIGKDIKK